MSTSQIQAEMDNQDLSSSLAKTALLSMPAFADVLAPNAESNMDRLNESDVASCILTATVTGHELLVRKLMERRGPVPIVVEFADEGENSFRLNGRATTVNFRYFAHQIRSPAALKLLLARITEYGMKGLIEPGPTFPMLWHCLDENQQLHRLRPTGFEGTLPTLIDGVLSHPELAVVLHDESVRTGTPEAYKPLLCWASEDMIRQFPQGLAPLRVVQVVENQGSLSEWKAKSGQPESLSYGAIEVGVRPSERCSEWVNILFGAMGPASSRIGLEDDQGQVLCETTADFLLAFPATSCSEAGMVVANSFVESYCPIEIMALQAAEACTRDFGLEKTIYHFPNYLTTSMSEKFDLLFTALVSDQRVKDLMTKEQWTDLLSKAEFIDVNSLLALYQVLGIDNSGASVTLDADDLLLLIDGGYRFADGTKVFDRDLDIREHNRHRDLMVTPSVRIPDRLSFTDASIGNRVPTSVIHAYLLSVYKGIHKMNLWPIQDVRPVDLAHALKMAARLDLGHAGHNKAMALHAYLANAGVEACAGAASSPTQWMKLTEVFTGDQLKPYLKAMPARAKGRVLEWGLGL